MDGGLAVQEGHPGADVPDDLPGLFLGERLLGVLLEHVPEVATREEFHDEDQPVWQGGDGPVDVYGVGAPQADHGAQLAQELFALPAELLLLLFPRLR